jgi:hypothetical protein
MRVERIKPLLEISADIRRDFASRAQKPTKDMKINQLKNRKQVLMAKIENLKSCIDMHIQIAWAREIQRINNQLKLMGERV